MAFQKKTFVWHIGWYSKNLIAYYTLEQNLFYYFFSDYNSFAEILLSFRCRFEGCIFFVNTRQVVLMKKMRRKIHTFVWIFRILRSVVLPIVHRGGISAKSMWQSTSYLIDGDIRNIPRSTLGIAPRDVLF